MLNKKDYCDYDTCVALKELGFDEKCHAFYEPPNNQFNTTSIKMGYQNSQVGYMQVVVCPTLYEAQRWLRKEKGLFLEISIYLSKYGVSVCNVEAELDKTHKVLYKSYGFESPEDALLGGIKETVKFLKLKEK